MLKRLSLLVAAGALAVMLAPQAEAFTPAPLGGNTDVIQVAGGCGLGWHRGPYGGCRRNGVYACRRVWTRYGWRRVCG